MATIPLDPSVYQGVVSFQKPVWVRASLSACMSSGDTTTARSRESCLFRSFVYVEVRMVAAAEPVGHAVTRTEKAGPRAGNPLWAKHGRPRGSIPLEAADAT